MATFSYDYTFTPNTPAKSSEVNSNFNAVKTFVEGVSNGTNIEVGAITESKIASGAVSESKIANSAVTDAKLNISAASGVVKVFASTAARDATITSPSAGMVVYINSNDANEGLYTYNGSSWTKGAGWNSPWGIVASTQVTSDSASATSSPVNVFTALSFTAVANRLYVISANCYPQVTDASGDTFFYANLIGTVTQNLMFLAPGYTVNIHRASTSYLYAPTVNTSVSINVEIGRFSGTGSVKNAASGSNPSQLFVYDIGPSGSPA